ncbi:hypothetical protein [Pukyongiella litopenaei]|uniref:Uncharacterized protein n=1 Tax=Pukyongiella litopenaei TaxID=2605946 RepID=A0A2S0MLH9_9RHOB|nr:hypothetical protein [Pukyongiella litopenaei]AVO36621.1 hypothetical protein C6Y53_02175 [Pukyongiella litopenaei]
MRPNTAPWSDTEILTALYLRDHEGLSASKIGARLGRSKSSVLGRLFRVDRETDASDPDKIGNGTLPPRWWKHLGAIATTAQQTMVAEND